MSWDNAHAHEALMEASAEMAGRPTSLPGPLVEVKPSEALPADEIEALSLARTAKISVDGRGVSRRLEMLEWRALIAGCAIAFPGLLVTLYFAGGWPAMLIGAAFLIAGSLVAQAPIWGDGYMDRADEIRAEQEVRLEWTRAHTPSQQA